MSKPKSKGQKILIATLVALTGLSLATVSGVVIAYNAFFERHERPNYLTYPGIYNIDRISSLERTTLSIKSGKNKLVAYLYECNNPIGLVCFSHGFHAGADDYIPIYKYLVEHNFSVLCYNMTGTFESEGDSCVGMNQALVDLDNVINYINNDEKLSNLPLFTMGHSLGGYAAGSVLSLHDNIKACALIAPMCNASTMMVDVAKEYVGDFALAQAPIFSAYQSLLFKKYVNYDVIQGINKRDIPIFIAHGVSDKIISYDKNSVMAKKDEITNPNVEFYTTSGYNGDHNNIWHSIPSAIYQNEVSLSFKALQKEKGDKLSKEDLELFSSKLNHDLYSEVNTTLLDKIIETFIKGLE